MQVGSGTTVLTGPAVLVAAGCALPGVAGRLTGRCARQARSSSSVGDSGIIDSPSVLGLPSGSPRPLS